MAKRVTGVGRMKRTHSYKTKKRLAAKHDMLANKKIRRHNRPLKRGFKKV